MEKYHSFSSTGLNLALNNSRSLKPYHKKMFAPPHICIISPKYSHQGEEERIITPVTGKSRLKIDRLSILVIPSIFFRVVVYYL